MTQGFLVFAHDNEQIEYGLLALAQAKRIRRILDKPVSIVLDDITKANLSKNYPGWQDHFDHVINSQSNATQTKRYGEGANQLTFHNLDRINAYDLSPYEETIVIDTDVLIQTRNLNKLWNSTDDLLVCDRCSDLQGNKTHEFTWISDKSIKFYWATVFYFKKTEFTKLFFDRCKWVKSNYYWLAHMYEIPPSPLRNDFVWSIALHDLGHPAASIPFNLIYSIYTDVITAASSDAVQVLSNASLCKVTHDLHVFNKHNLTDLIRKELL